VLLDILVHSGKRNERSNVRRALPPLLLPLSAHSCGQEEPCCGLEQTKPQAWPPPPHRQMSYTFLCFLIGGRATFPVDIEQTKLVGHLKEEIKKKIPNQLNHIDPEHLTLYQVEVDASHKPTYLRQLDEISKTLDPLSELNDAKKLSAVFPEGPLEMKIQILVQPPEGESIYCGGVILMADVVNTPEHTQMTNHPRRLPTILSMLRRFHLPRLRTWTKKSKYLRPACEPYSKNFSRMTFNFLFGSRLWA